MIELFGLRAGPGMQAALTQGTGKLEELIKKIDNAGNIAERIAKAQMETLDGKIKIMKSNFEALQIAIGDAFGDKTAKLVGFLANRFDDLAWSIKTVSKALADPTAQAAQTEGEIRRQQNVIRQREIGRMLETGMFRASYPMGHPLAGVQVSPTMLQAQGATAGMMAGTEPGRLGQITDAQRIQLQNELNRLREEEKKLIEGEVKARKEKEDQDKGDDKIKKPLKMLDFDAARARYLRQIASTDLDIAAPGLVDALAQIGYKGAQAVKDSVAAAFTPTMIGNVISPLTEAAHALAKKQAEAAEAAAEIAHNFNKAGEAVTKIGGAVMSGRAGATFGPELGAMAGGAIAGAVSGGTATGLGSAIGGIVGGLLGEALDELIKSVGVLTPLFDLAADVLKPLQPVLVLIREVLAAFGSVLKSLVVPFLHTFVDSLLPLVYIAYALFKAFEPLLVAIFSVANVIFGALYSPMILFAQALASVFGLLEGIFNVGKEAFNGFANAINTFFDNLRNIEVLGQKPFAGLTVTIPKIETEFMTLAEITAMETEAREESTRAIREFNEEMTNVPIGVKRLRAMQYSATGVPFPGMFNSSPFLL